MSDSPWQWFLKQVTVGGALPMEFSCTDLDADGNECVRITMMVPHVGSPEPSPDATRIPIRLPVGMTIPITRVLPLPEWSGNLAACEWVRTQVHWFYRHEADEQLNFAGSATFRPDHEH